ncbi:hypothetical protein C8J56DRAFT_1109845 [Mycena floridula]|nr:hypothetical protein C8J56DRAFT_1109845 [Mycena floridula]
MQKRQPVTVKAKEIHTKINSPKNPTSLIPLPPQRDTARVYQIRIQRRRPRSPELTNIWKQGRIKCARFREESGRRGEVAKRSDTEAIEAEAVERSDAPEVYANGQWKSGDSCNRKAKNNWRGRHEKWFIRGEMAINGLVKVMAKGCVGHYHRKVVSERISERVRRAIWIGRSIYNHGRKMMQRRAKGSCNAEEQGLVVRESTVGGFIKQEELGDGLASETTITQGLLMQGQNSDTKEQHGIGRACIDGE